MLDKEVADQIRDSANKHLATAVDMAANLMALADSLDPPREPAAVGTCDRCGRTTTNEAKVGKPCLDPNGFESTCLGTILPEPREPDAWKPETHLSCDACGLRISALPGFDGEICWAAAPDGSPCAGQFRASRTMETTKVNTCTCDRCGDQVRGLQWIGDPCLCLDKAGRDCPGRYRLDPEPDEELTTVDGQSLGVTRDELAMEAVRDYVHGHGDKVPDIDMASTYGGRS